MPYEKRAQKFKTKVNMKVTELNVKQVKWAIRACEDKRGLAFIVNCVNDYIELIKAQMVEAFNAPKAEPLNATVSAHIAQTVKGIAFAVVATLSLSGCASALSQDCARGNEIQCQYLTDKCDEGDQDYCKALTVAQRQRDFYNQHPEVLAVQEAEQARANANTTAFAQCNLAGGQWTGTTCNVPQQINVNVSGGLMAY
ncbi:TPA: hypothetical protein I4G69_003969 [Enterobacter asburiae]|nr:hypothetical protein [Enterobacter asburiae]